MDATAAEHVRILIAAEPRFYRDGLAVVLDQHPRLTVVGSAASVEDAVARAREQRPDVAIVDLRGSAGLLAVEALAETPCPPRVVALAVSGTDAEIVELAEAGVSAYVTRDDSLEDLVDVVVRAAEGELLCSPKIAAALLRRVAEARESVPREPVPQLTPRETEIMRLVDTGLSNKEIAVRLQIEPATVKNHVHNILEKLRAHTRTEAVAVLRRDGALSR